MALEKLFCLLVYLLTFNPRRARGARVSPSNIYLEYLIGTTEFFNLLRQIPTAIQAGYGMTMRSRVQFNRLLNVSSPETEVSYKIFSLNHRRKLRGSSFPPLVDSICINFHWAAGPGPHFLIQVYANGLIATHSVTIKLNDVGECWGANTT
jgi:hypothetical protein